MEKEKRANDYSFRVNLVSFCKPRLARHEFLSTYWANPYPENEESGMTVKRKTVQTVEEEGFASVGEVRVMNDPRDLMDSRIVCSWNAPRVERQSTVVAGSGRSCSTDHTRPEEWGPINWRDLVRQVSQDSRRDSEGEKSDEKIGIGIEREKREERREIG